MNITQLPDISRSFQLMKLQDAIAENLHPSMFAEVCRDGVYKNLGATVNMIREQMKDNPDMTRDIIGEKALRLMCNLFPDVAKLHPEL